MNTSSFFLPARQRALLVAAILALGGVSWAASALPGAGKPTVSVKIDEAPLASANTALGASYAPIVKRVSPSVVKVLVAERAKTVTTAEGLPPFFSDPAFREFFGEQFGNGRGSRRTQRQPQQEGLGSGVVVSADGYILTNNHVVQGADTIKVSFNDGRQLTAKVIGTDPQSDLAVIKVEAKDLPAVTFANSDKLEVGDRVLAVGNPFGIGQTVTSGMVSGLGRATLGLDYEDFIQTDAAINPGNSGGALVDAEGRLIGINTAILSRSGGFQGIGFAIPANMARGIMEQLVANGKVVRGYLGVSVTDVTPALAEQFDVKPGEGALVADVVPGSPAAKSGLEGGDIVTALDGKKVKDGRTLKLTVANFAPGSTVKAEVLRDGKPHTLDLSVGDRPGQKSLKKNGRGLESPDRADEGSLNGVGVGDLDARSRREFDVPSRVRGALVTDVDPNSAAAEAGLQPGDVIQEINRRAVASADEAVKLTETSSESGKTLLRVWRQGGSSYIVVDESATADNE